MNLNSWKLKYEKVSFPKSLIVLSLVDGYISVLDLKHLMTLEQGYNFSESVVER